MHKKNTKIKSEKNPVLTGSSYLVEEEKSDYKFNPNEYCIQNMESNKAYLNASNIKKESVKQEILRKMKNEYSDYRKNWIQQPEECIEKKVDNKKLLELGYKPLCLDLETASNWVKI